MSNGFPNCDGKPKPALRGPTTGGTVIAFCIGHLDRRNITVRIGGVVAEVNAPANELMRATTPAVDRPQVAAIEVITSSGRVTVTQTFEYYLKEPVTPPTKSGP